MAKVAHMKNTQKKKRDSQVECGLKSNLSDRACRHIEMSQPRGLVW